MNWIEAIILGVIQGLTEFLPVSSSGHLEIGTVLLNVQTSENLLFAVMVHLATALATILVFREDILSLIGDILKFEWNDATRFLVAVIISMIPVFIVGVFFKDEVEAFFTGNLMLVGAMLWVTGGLLLFAHYKKDGSGAVGFGSAFVIGISQAIAVLPGISRSGATISTALILGVERSKAARFSFLMVLAPILGASVLQMKDYAETPGVYQVNPAVLVVGFLAAFLSGFFACKWMIKIVKKGRLTHFSIYCFIVGAIAIIAAL
ncbi:MAG: undecaprenyl-diphosphate phosphatase [Ekhidna sp.]